MPTVCILYGFCEGPAIGKRFRVALKAKGYKVIDDPIRADIIIAHSGGSFLLPPITRAKQIIHIGMGYWPEKSWFVSTGHKLWHDLRNHRQEDELSFWTRKTLWNSIYLWRMPTNIRMFRGLQAGRHWQHGKVTWVVRPRFDSYSKPGSKHLTFKDAPTFISVPGHHDDCWRNPAPYIALLKS